MPSEFETQCKKCNPWIFILEDAETRIDRMTKALNAAWNSEAWAATQTACAAIAWLEKHYSGCEVISLDHDLGPANGSEDPGVGMDVVLWLERQPPTARIIIHSANVPAGAEMFNRLARAGFKVYRVFPIANDRWVEDDWLKSVNLLKDWGKE
ncbi:MAG: hypothetical protein HQM09_17510 [Candidatus Riflebacteria bacterium]|nr:hypothetical protein [Candidatus Riflebacteria bacterium]